MKKRLLHLAAVLALAFTLTYPGATFSAGPERMVRPAPQGDCDGSGSCPS